MLEIKQSTLTLRDRAIKQAISGIWGLMYRRDIEQFGLEKTHLWYIDERLQVDLSEPPEGLSQESPHSKIQNKKLLEKDFILTMCDVKLLGPDAVGISRDGIILELTAAGDDTFKTHHDTAALASSIYSGLRAPKRQSTEIKCSLVNNYSSVYYHWIVDILPKIQGIELYESVTGNNVRIIIPPNPPSWMITSLNVLGYDSGDWEVWDGGNEHVESLLIVSRRKHGKIPKYSSIKWLRRKVRHKLNTHDTSDEFSKRVFVSRRDADWRRLVNLDRILDIIEPYGFEEFIPTNHSIAEQMHTFSEADFIMGPHGSNLANIVFSSDCVVCEIFGDSPRTADYWILSEELNIEYTFLKGTSHGKDIKINPELVRSKLEKILK